MANVKYEIKEHLLTLEELKGGWTKELNLVKWNKGIVKYDIRNWDENHTRCSAGVTLTKEQFEMLKNID